MKSVIIRLVALGLLLTTEVMAQMPQDAIYMPKNTTCVALTFGQSQWKDYWEGTLKRQNFNIGTHTTRSAMAMAAVGLSRNLNVIVALPYIQTRTSAGNLMGQQGFQDVSAWVKYRAFEKSGFSVHGIVGASAPITNYVPDFLPMSIGIQSRTLTGRILLNYQHARTGLYVTTHGSYIGRSNINVDRDGYQAYNRLWNSHEVRIPNAYDAALRIGVLRRKWQTEIWAEHMAAPSGDDIRRNDMPFPTNNMEATTLGWYGKVQPKNLGMNARVGYVLSGRNMGQSTSLMIGVLYQLNY